MRCEMKKALEEQSLQGPIDMNDFENYLAWPLRSFFLRARRFSLSPLFLFFDTFFAGRDFFNFFMNPPQINNSVELIIKK